MSNPLGKLTGLLTAGLLAWLPLLAAVCPPGVNLTDRDGDGLADHACVGDWDGDGTCEMADDIQAAIASLTDPGEKLVELHGCRFHAPLVASHFDGILALTDHLTLQGSGDATVLGRASVRTTSCRGRPWSRMSTTSTATGKSPSAICVSTVGGRMVMQAGWGTITAWVCSSSAAATAR